MVANSELYSAVASLAHQEGAEPLLSFAHALECGALRLQSATIELQRKLGIPTQRLRPYQAVLQHAADPTIAIVALRAAASTATTLATQEPLVEVAWTFPGQSDARLRTTGGVAREVIDGARDSLLIVGYSIATQLGLASHIANALATAGERGIVITAVLHREANKAALLQAWKRGVPLPSIFTWPKGDDPMASIHAKLLVADRRDAFVTSANLTYHGLEGNLEMGIRVIGSAAAEVSHGIHSLIRKRHLIEWK